MGKKIITTPLTDDIILKLNAGDEVLISGTLYTGRDAAHKRMISLLEKGESLPFDIRGQVIYYVGPCPAPDGRVIGSAGPTTSGRMDLYAPKLIELGLKGMIGKGLRDENVAEAIKAHKAIYFGAIGGAGALISSCIKKQEIIAFEDLGTEAIRRIEVENLPCVVIIDSSGRDRYKEGRKKYRIEG
ncbi:MAG: Fe-S-containing hydro-lyase [Clostridiaceae bacterium]|jgi:fumarate hydratase subunit beta|nr:Fe-S-containing hydro-lyase [Clostridiaceae bacterium]